MTLPQNVKDAVKLLDYTSVPLTTENNLRAWQTIRAHLTSQEAEIADLIGKRDFLLRHYNLAESRLAAANALLGDVLHQYPHINRALEAAIDKHLQGAGDEASPTDRSTPEVE